MHSSRRAPGESEVKRIAIAAAASALAACASTPAPPEPHIFVMRHLHKALGPQDPGLTPQGQACAQQLARFLGNQDIRAVYASTTRRAQETAAPLAAARSLTAQTYAPADTAGVAARARAETGSVLIVGHSNTVPEIVERLGGTRPAPIEDSRYADVWRVTKSNGATLAMTVPGC
jgi:broad specificity phosphatase PhoE